MTPVLDPDIADLTLLQDRQVAVLGYDALAAAHALNLRDSGVDVQVGLPPDSRGGARAEMDGLVVVEPAAAVRRCDIVLVPAEPGPQATAGHGHHDLAQVQTVLDQGLEDGDLVLVTTGELAAEGGLRVPAGVDLAMLCTLADGERLREEYLDGRGSPALVAVERDASGAAWATVAAYAQAMGALRSGAITTTIAHQARATALAEERIHEPLRRAVQDTFDQLVAEGIEEEVAYVAALHELKARVDQVYASGFASQHGPDGRPLAAVSGAAGEGAGSSPSSRREAARSAHPVELVGRRVRGMMSWIR